MARSRPLADFLDASIGAVMAQRGFADSEIMLGWPEIVGPELAARTRPERLQWPRRRNADQPEGATLHVRAEGATLHVRVEPGFALEAQHLAPIILERLAAYFGWRCVQALRFQQGRIARPAASRQAARPDAATLQAAAEQVADVADTGLREALARLGAAILSEKARAPRKKP
jgi:hypothetical protein